MDTFDVKPLDKGWFYRCENRGVSAGDPEWTRSEALHQAELRAFSALPAELHLYGNDGERIIAIFRLPK